MPERKPVRVGMIGAGSIAQEHFRALAATGRAEIVGVADINLAAASKAASEYGGKPVVNLRELLETEPEAVIVCTPPNQHADQTEEALAAGVHVLCEKPMALTLADCDRMIVAAKRAGRQLMIGQALRYYAGPKTLIEIARSGELGEIVSCWVTRVSYYRTEGAPPWRFNPRIGGGTVVEWGVHEIDLLRMIGGEVKSVYAQVAHTRPEAPDFDDHAHAVLTLGNGVIGRLDLATSSHYDETTRGIAGTEGAAWCGWGDVSLRRAGHDDVEIVKPRMPVVAESVNAAMYMQADQFLRAIQTGTPVPIPGEEGRADIAVALAILDSGETGRRVLLD